MNRNIIFPQGPILDPSTGQLSLEWLLWLQNPQFLSLELGSPIGVSSGGTGLESGTSGGILGFTDTETIASSAELTQHALVIGGGAGFTPATPVGLGTTHTVLHGNAIGDPSWGVVDLAADVSGNLPVTNLGSGTNADATTFWRGDGTWASAGYVAGTYTPTVTAVSNLDAVTAHQCQYMKVGATVTVSGQVDADPTVINTQTDIGVSLPIASNFAAASNAAGTASANVDGRAIGIFADIVNKRLNLRWICGFTTNLPVYFTATYQVI